MRLGQPLFEHFQDPSAWVAAVRRQGCSAAYCPVDEKTDHATVAAFARAAAESGIAIAEVGAWSNPISPDEETRRNALEFCKARLDLAERIGARCCVNIAGSRSTQWDGPHPDNLTDETFDLIVQTVREILDAVEPSGTFYTLETMPWVFPDSADSYARLLKAVDRPGFAVHLDPANLISSPQRFFRNADLLRECFRTLGPWIRSCHAKDIALEGRMTTHLDEVRPGLGGMDYRVFLRELESLDPDMPLMLEHLSSREEYALAASYVRSVAAAEGIRI